ncbi:hypothetical protein PVK64_00065 [Aliivibrio sp. S4TY2]|uniref:hypothetical protein n=1 Tax=unclassified Aliivibrio TaxID=2645654 RepID=UPI0023789E3C|nr:MULTISPECIES: hypothetical protein [unclassified Aliivibrio]MDD9154581.1 hypothetical protein [Aliivibrio sp. S4TY2]MDD9159056.1 hypothetical protein [Aliivibrio sp. S4TY1]MDD9162584.1 hypothetical protein [Aliivibrio sp. S4MY2]MDD9167055.1 hypothetical protein [Aliivibrio sp. S4MY4]MDD9183661.1 hypothetical protein [Aliivibrio sp. S4MY3]
MTILQNLQKILNPDCFKPNPTGNSIVISQCHKLADDGETPLDWTQELKITNLDGDEIFICFDWDDHKIYSRYLIGNAETLTGKACDYIMLKEEADEWHVYIGELKLGKNSFDGEKISRQINGSLAFLRYISEILLLQFNCDKLKKAKIHKLVVYKKPLQRTKNRPKIKQGMKKPLSRLRPHFGFFTAPHNDITMIGLPFSQSSKHHSLALTQFMRRTN